MSGVADDAREQDQVDTADTEHLPLGPAASQHNTLKYRLLGPSLTKAGQDSVDQRKVSEIIYNASKGSRFFNNEENRDKNLTIKINRILAKKQQLEKLDLKNDLRKADDLIAQLELTRDLSQAVVHIDCDAFYAAVEELDRPELKDVPFAVGKGVLTTCNYHARKFGCRSGMAGFVADKLCPQLIHISLNFEKYTAKAREVRAVLAKYDPRFESASIDEAYMNVTEYCDVHKIDAEAAVQQMREEVHEACKITISAGIAVNTKLAKICSNQNKPNGQFRLPPDRTSIMAFMRDLPTRKVNGIGRVFERELDAIGIKTCGDIYAYRQYLAKLFGDKAFEFLISVYLGLGRTSVQPAEEYERKSVGTESTFHDMDDPSELREKLRWIADELEKDCERTQFKGRTLVLKIKLHTYEVFTRQVIPPKAVHLADDLYRYSLPMLAKLEQEMPGLKLRLMGLRLTHLVSLKKPGADFFGKRAGGSVNTTKDGPPARGAAAAADEAGWEVWPDDEFEDAARQERDDELEALERLSQDVANVQAATASASEATPIVPAPQRAEHDTNAEHAAFVTRKHDNGFAWRAMLEEERRNARLLSKASLAGPDPLSAFAPSAQNPTLPSSATRHVDASDTITRRTDEIGEEQGQGKEESLLWDCPVCGLAQRADEKGFNAHIDACLSRGAIREVLRTEQEQQEKGQEQPRDNKRKRSASPNVGAAGALGSSKRTGLTKKAGVAHKVKDRRLFFA